MLRSTFCSLLVLVILAVSGHADLLDHWSQWKAQHHKIYTAQEEQRAYDAWSRHWHLVQSHNNRNDVTFTLALNEFSDKERRAPHTQRSPTLRYVPEVVDNHIPRAPPASLDWRKRGVISLVHNQGELGSADAYSVSDALESLHAIKTGRLHDLSMDEVAACCSSGEGAQQLVTDIFECISRLGGLCSRAGYPRDQGHCANDSCTPIADDASRTVYVAEGEEAGVVRAVVEVPVVVYVDASRSSFQLYTSGIYQDPLCSHNPDHAMLLVGYDVDSSGLPYWILKNTWGDNWGMGGYMLMKRGVNMCGIANFAHYPK